MGGGGGVQIELAQVVLVPRKRPWREAQTSAVTTTHSMPPAAVRTQQAPLGGGGGRQASPVHAVPRPRKMPPRVKQTASLTTTHCTPVLERTQQAPVGGSEMHAPVAQRDPLPR